MFRTALSDYKVSVSDELEGIIGASARLGPEELLEACTRESYVQPVLQIVPNMETRLGQDFMDGYHQQYESRTVEQSQEERSSGTARGKQKRVEIGALLNQ